MSDKEWEVKYNEYDNTYTVKEAKKYDLSYTPSTDLTVRERLNKGLRNMRKGWKIFLTIFLNFYGSLYRFSSNTVIGFIYGFAELVVGKILCCFVLSEFVMALYEARYEEAQYLLPIVLILALLWIVDFISVIVKNDIVFLGNKKYKNYRDYKKK